MSGKYFDEILDEGLSLALDLLMERGEFAPFAIEKLASGEIRHLQVMLDDQSETHSVISKLKVALRDDAANGRLLAAALVCECVLLDKTTNVRNDAIQVDLDAFGESPIRCCMPYAIVDGQINEGEVKSWDGQAFVFDHKDAE